MKIAIVDKCPNKNRYQDYFDFEFDLFHLCSENKPKILKADVTLETELLDEYDYVILVGAEPSKHIGKITSVTTSTGILINEKYFCIINPAMLIFKPEGKQDFERAVMKITKNINGDNQDAAKTGNFKGIQTVKELEEYLDLLESLPFDQTLAVDTETSSLHPRDGYVLGISISHELNQGVYILSDIIDDTHVARLQVIFNHHPIVFHNMKFDYKMLRYHFGFTFKQVDDTMLEHYVLDENNPHGLKELAIKYTNYGDYDSPLKEFMKDYCSRYKILQEDFSYAYIPFDIIATYAAIDTAVTLQLHKKFKPVIQNHPKLTWVYDNLLVAGTLFLMEVEETGIPMDIKRLMAAGEYLDKEINEAKQALYKFKELHKFEEDSGKIFNPNSTQQLRSLLFDYLKLQPTGKKTATGAISTDAEVLEELAGQHALPKAILELRKMGKLKNTYITKIIEGIDKDNRIRTGFNLIFTTSGRLSSSGKFNAQQLPRDNPLIKGCIKARPGYKIVSQDLATAEVYYAAVLSGDKNLQAVFKSGGDLHSTIAKMVFNLPCAVEDVKKLYPLDRQAAKAITFGILYGSGPAKVVESVNKEGGNLSIEEARDIIKDYYTKFKDLKRWLDERKAFIMENGFTYSFFGRKRRLPNVKSSDKGIASHEVRSGINSEVQSIASDVNLLASIEVREAYIKRGLDANIIMLVHDSIVAEVAEKDLDEYCILLKETTQMDRGCSIPGFPIGVDQDIADDYSFGKFEKTYEFTGNILSRIQATDSSI
jgi:DNA polymerase I-like protein with 3'-5' exonuclease and polymerase domains